MSDKTMLTKTDVGHGTARAILKGIPYIGESLHQFIYGPLEDIRWRRLEQTLGEVGQAVKDAAKVQKEEFVALLEKVGPQVTRETSEERRQFFRDLLINAAGVETGSRQWGDANLAADLIASIDPPGLAILAAIAKCVPRPNFISSQPTPRIYSGGEEFTKPTDSFYLIEYSWPVVQEWTHRLRERRLLGLGSSDARGGFGGVQLTDLGQFLVDWGLRMEQSGSRKSNG